RIGARLSDFSREVLAHWRDGRIKLYLTWRALSARRAHPGLFAAGEYRPLNIVGPARDHAFAFMRRLADRYALAAVPRLLTAIVKEEQSPCDHAVWQDTTLELPADVGRLSWTNQFTGEKLALTSGADARFLVATLFTHFPVALLIG